DELRTASPPPASPPARHLPPLPNAAHPRPLWHHSPPTQTAPWSGLDRRHRHPDRRHRHRKRPHAHHDGRRFLPRAGPIAPRRPKIAIENPIQKLDAHILALHIQLRPHPPPRRPHDLGTLRRRR